LIQGIRRRNLSFHLNPIFPMQLIENANTDKYG